MEAYTDAFYDELQGTEVPSARLIAPVLMDLVSPNSLVDVGCGTGHWVETFRKLGVADVAGLDGPWVAEDKIAFPIAQFQRADLSQPIKLGRRFDLAVSLEVAEHLPPERADGFVGDLCALAPVVLFSAAIPGQGGLNHINEQWPGYWAEMFEKRGYQAYDIIRTRVWNRDDVTWWYKQNIVVYADRALDGCVPVKAAELPGLVHPELYMDKVRKLNPRPGRAFKQFLRSLKG